MFIQKVSCGVRLAASFISMSVEAKHAEFCSWLVMTTVSSDQVGDARTFTDRKRLISVRSHLFVSGGGYETF